MSDDPRDPNLENLLGRFGEVLLEAVRVMLPGRIESYDADKQMASVQPLIRERFLDEDGETVVTRDIPVIHNCPVVFLGSARGRITYPVAVGDTCEIRFSSSAIARWVLSGGIVDPGDDRHHDVNDAVVEVGLHDFSHVPTTAPTDAVVIHCGSGVEARIGGDDATQAVVVQSALDDFGGALQGAIDDPSVAADSHALLALQTLKDKLDALNSASGWKANTSKAKAK